MRVRFTREPFDYSNTKRSNADWPDHRLRVMATAAMIAWLRPNAVIDPACGDGSVVECADHLSSIQHAVLSDISPSYRRPRGKVNWTVFDTDLAAMMNLTDDRLGRFDVVVLTEILEHLEDPDDVLRWAANVGDYLVASSPEMRDGQVDHNPEHLWMFDGPGYEQMLNEAGWKVLQKTHLTFRSEYDFGIYVAEKP